jgi:hypothetical protein
MSVGFFKENALKECMIKIHPTAVTDDKNELRIIMLTSGLMLSLKARKEEQVSSELLITETVCCVFAIDNKQ